MGWENNFARICWALRFNYSDDLWDYIASATHNNCVADFNT